MNKPKQPEKENIVIVRHWVAKYQKLKTTPPKTTFFPNEVDDFMKFADENKDLVEDSLPELKKSVSEFFESNAAKIGNKKIVIRVSPFWRTIETATEIIKYITENNYNLRKISIVEEIQEVKWFERRIFDTLVRWWELEVDWKKVQVNKSETNPDNLNHSDYFTYWKHREINHLWDKIKNTETYEEISTRSKKVLSRAEKAVSDDTVVIMVTHQWFSDHLIHKKDWYVNWWMKPGEFLIYK